MLPEQNVVMNMTILGGNVRMLYLWECDPRKWGISSVADQTPGTKWASRMRGAESGMPSLNSKTSGDPIGMLSA